MEISEYVSINPHTGRPFIKDYFKKYARMKPCQVRIARECGYACTGRETTVLAHANLPGLKAMGKKLMPDLLGAWACAACHDLVDGRAQPKAGLGITADMIQQWHLEGMARTIALLVSDGYLPNP